MLSDPSYLHEVPKGGTFMETESGTVVARNWGEGNGSVVVNG